MSGSADSPSVYWVPIVDHTFRILEVFPDAHTELALKDVISHSGVGRTSTFRILFTLAEKGYISKNPSTRRYSLGPRIREIARKSIGFRNLAQITRPYLKQLRDRFDETVNLAVVRDGEIIYVDIVESRQNFRMTAAVGARAALHATAIGKAVAAFLPIDGLNAKLSHYSWVRFTHRTVTDQKKFMEILRRVRRLGYSVDSEESERGACCVGAPIFDVNSQAIAAISVSGPTYRIRSKQKSIVREITKAAKLISQSQQA